MIITNTYWELSRHQTLCLTRKDCTRKDCQSVYIYGNWGSEQGCDLLWFTPWGSDRDWGLAPRCHGCQPDVVGLSVCAPGGAEVRSLNGEEEVFFCWCPGVPEPRTLGLWGPPGHLAAGTITVFTGEPTWPSKGKELVEGQKVSWVCLLVLVFLCLKLSSL